MNQVPEEKRESLTKVFAIVGFVAIILFALWLAVQIVSVIPSAFSSLASLADSVYNYDKQQDLVVSTPNSVVNAGESVTVVWTKMRNDGVYSFSYKCTDGVAIDAKDAAGQVVSVVCGTPLSLDAMTSIDLIVASEKSRFVDVAYTITFNQTGVKDSSLSTTKTITVVNPSVPTVGAQAPVIQTPATQTPTTPTVVAPTVVKKPIQVVGTPTTIKKYIYAVPVSNPNGKTDLQITYLGVGTLNGKVFTPATAIKTTQNGAIQFEIKNIGTKTSDAWDYTADLPAGIAYTSGSQLALKPNERAVITLGFEGVTQTGVQKFGVHLNAKNDINKNNDAFTWSVVIVK